MKQLEAREPMSSSCDSNPELADRLRSPKLNVKQALEVVPHKNNDNLVLKDQASVSLDSNEDTEPFVVPELQEKVWELIKKDALRM